MSAPATPTGFAVTNKAITGASDPQAQYDAQPLASPSTKGAIRFTWSSPETTATYHV